jgi:hypothetical protein
MPLAPVGQRDVLGPAAGAATPNGATQAASGAPPKSLRSAVGSIDYYQQRNQDFVTRHAAGTTPAGGSAPGSTTPPTYYLAYGDKYAHVFTLQLRPTLSKVGQTWVDKTFLLLQGAIEDKLDASPQAFARLEENSGAFQQFAYDTHPAAYVGTGICGVPCSDALKIGLTPSFSDLMNLPGIEQMVSVVMSCPLLLLCAVSRPPGFRPEP